MNNLDEKIKTGNLSRRDFIRLGVLGISAFLIGCENKQEASQGNDDYKLTRDLPKATDNIVFDEHARMGDFQIGTGEYIGVDKWLAENPDYALYNNHDGGLGDTLEFYSSSRGIYLQWAWASLITIAVLNGWQGKVNGSEIRIRSTKEEFLAKYPNARVEEKTRWGLEGGLYISMNVKENEKSNVNPTGETRLTADFENDVVKRLRIDAWGRKSYNGYWGP